MNSVLEGRLIYVSAVLVWGSSFILMKEGLKGYAPAEVGLMRVSIAGLVMAPFAIRYVLRTTRWPYWKLIVTGLTGTLLPFLAFPIAQTVLPSGVVGILNALTPLFTFVLGILLFGVAFTYRRFAGVLIGLAGALMIVLVDSEQTAHSLGKVAGYTALALLATLLYGFNANWVKFRLNDLHPLAITSLSMTLTGLPALPVLLFATDFPAHLAADTTHRPLVAILVLAVIGTALMVALFYRLLKVFSALAAASVTYLIPIVALAWGVLDGETLSPLHGVGLLVILVGVYLVSRPARRRKPSIGQP